MRFLYVCVGDNKYFKQLFVSVRTLLSSQNLGCEVVVYTDNPEKLNLLTSKFQVEVVVFEGQDEVDVVYSRLAKIKAIANECQVGKKFVYLDTDTVILNKWVEIDLNYSIGAVLDGNRLLESHPHKDYIREKFSRCGKLASNRHFNGGVLSIGDPAKAKDIINEWYETYQKLYQEYGVSADQTSLNEVLEDSLGVIELNHCYNAQMGMYLNFERPIVLHYLNSNEVADMSIFNSEKYWSNDLKYYVHSKIPDFRYSHLAQINIPKNEPETLKWKSVLSSLFITVKRVFQR